MAVELKELRIGNWIIPNDEKYWKSEFNKIPIIVDKGVIQSFVIKLPSTENYFDYIELTQKLLEKFGFGKTASHGDYILISNEISTISNNRIVIKNNKYENYVELLSNYVPDEQKLLVAQSCEIKYLPQLQNLFYSLTGIELNDIVAYEYYKKIHKELTGFDGSYLLEFFISKIGTKETSICEKLPTYTIGDLPPNLFA